jgi:hypothetical protein
MTEPTGRRTAAPDEPTREFTPEEEAEYFLMLGYLRTHSMDHMGRCITCGHIGPCSDNRAAMQFFEETHWLPLREPGATNPELVNANRIA